MTPRRTEKAGEASMPLNPKGTPTKQGGREGDEARSRHVHRKGTGSTVPKGGPSEP
jgi:hypothetical protein